MISQFPHSLIRKFNLNLLIIRRFKTMKTVHMSCKKITAFICVVAVVMSFFTVPSLAAIPGNGTETSPYLIYTLKDLEAIRNDINSGTNYSGRYIKLMNDIVMNDQSVFTFDENGLVAGIVEGATPYEWTPIGLGYNSSLGYSTAMNGHFDGNGYKIIGLYVNSGNYGGFFGYCYGAEIKNLSINGGYVSGSDYLGALVGSMSDSTVTNCSNTSAVSGNSNVGGLVGYADASDISSCLNNGIINGQASVGGIIGRAIDNSNVTLCQNHGTIISTKNATGGISGSLDNAYITLCYNTGSVTGKSDVGGISGLIVNSEIGKCYNSGHLSSFGAYWEGDIGGIVGNDNASNSKTIIHDCFNIGSIELPEGLQQDNGGIVGRLQGRLERCYSTKGNKIYGAKTTSGYIGYCYYLSADNDNDALTDSQMRSSDSFKSYDFETVWTMDGNPNYPYPELIIPELVLSTGGSGLPSIPSDEDYQMIIEKKTHYIGDDSVKLSVSFKNAIDIKSLAVLSFYYDTSALQLVNREWKISDCALSDWDSQSDSGVIAFEENQSVEGNVFELTFSVLDGTPDGEYEIGCDVAATTKTEYSTEASISIFVVNGSITVSSIIKGDVNGDGVVNSTDAIHLLYYTFLPDMFPVNQDCDFDGNGSVNSDDAIYLLYYTFLPDMFPLN